MESKKIKFLLVVFILLIGLAGFSLADPGNGDINREKSVRIQDVAIWYDKAPNEFREGYIKYTHYANVPFNIYIFITNPGQNQNIPVGEATSFRLTLNGPNDTIIDLGEITVDENGEATVSEPIEVTIPFGGDWSVVVKTDNDNYKTGGDGGSGGGNEGDSQIIIDIPIMTGPTPIVELTPLDATVDVGETVRYTAKLINAETNEEITYVDDDGNEFPLIPEEDWIWSSSDETKATHEDPPGTFRGISPGDVTVTVEYGDVKATAQLTVVAGAPDHLAIVPFITGEEPIPKLNIRSDVVGSSTSTWGYIGEPMIINVALQMQGEDNSVVEGYSWSEEWFNDPVNWNISFTSQGNPDPTLFSVSIISLDTHDPFVLRATIEVKQDAYSVQNEFDNFQLEIDPRDPSDKKLEVPAKAYVVDNGVKIEEPYHLYGGRIKVADDYFNIPEGTANIFVEKYHGDRFMTNTEDSTNYQTNWLFLLGNSEIYRNVKFNQGRAQIVVSNHTSYTEKQLKPVENYPDYLEVLPGILRWGQIVENPPSSGGGTIWEKEIVK